MPFPSSLSKTDESNGDADADADAAVKAKVKAKAKAKDEFYKYNYVRIGPHGSNLLRWHFSIMGPTHSCYENGIYHGRILLPKDYPMSPPRVQMLTPSGRFVPGGDICLSASAFHPETWTPRWTILSLVDALRLHMLTSANEIGGVDASTEQRKRFAVQSRLWRAGSIDHGRMVKCGLFCQSNDDDNDDYDEAVEKENGVGDEIGLLGRNQIMEESLRRRRRQKSELLSKTKQKVTNQGVVVGTALWVVKSPLRLGIMTILLYRLWKSLMIVDR